MNDYNPYHELKLDNLNKTLIKIQEENKEIENQNKELAEELKQLEETLASNYEEICNSINSLKKE